MTGELNVFCRLLGELIGERRWEKKWLIAPTKRVGYQWLDSLTRAGFFVLNVRVITLPGLALELASPEMLRRGLSFLGDLQAEMLMGRLFSELGEKSRRESGQDGGYIFRLSATRSLVQSLLRTISDLRLAGIGPENLLEGAFEVREKWSELRALLAGYETLLREKSLIDYADALRLARERLAGDPVFSHQDLLLLAEDAAGRLHGLERAFWESVPKENRVLIRVDRAGEAVEGPASDLSRLRFLLKPELAGPPLKDGTVKILRAVGEVNEVREIFRRCMEERIALDEVEIIHSDYATYAPLIYETAHLLKEGEEDPPVTFAEGIPVKYSRPGRALLGLAQWFKEAYSPQVLAGIIQDGLFDLKVPEGRKSLSRLAAAVKSLPIGGGREGFRTAVERMLSALKERLRRGEEGEEETVEPAEAEEKKKNLLSFINLFEAFRSLVEELLEAGPREMPAEEFLGKICAVLEKYCIRRSQTDEYSLHYLKQRIEEMRSCLTEGPVPGFDEVEWLAGLPRELRVEGQGPRPGKVFVSSLISGGHSGRRHTFIVGLDEARFPAGGAQDPLALDQERESLSPELPTAAGRLSQGIADLGGLLARLRGRLTMSYSCRDLTDDRELFPSPLLISAYRLLSENAEGNLDEFMRDISGPVSFAPQNPENCIDITDWWLWRVCGEEGLQEPELVIAESFPHLGRGKKARAARESDVFTEYDGYVPEAGWGEDPARAPTVSATQLETLAKCPLEYFFKYVLNIQPPEEYGLKPLAWLDQQEKGVLLHKVFRIFMTELTAEGLRPNYKRDFRRLEKILESAIEEKLQEKPVPGHLILQSETDELKVIGKIFLKSEEERCKSVRPWCFEATLGMKQEGTPTPLDTPEPVSILLPGGVCLRGKGKIDRVDEVESAEGRAFEIWDYKTGSASSYDKNKPFGKGQWMQNLFYLKLMEARLREIQAGAEVHGFGYFFPGTKEWGKRIYWPREELEDGVEFLACLREMIRLGCFIFTCDQNDTKFSNYRAAFIDEKAAAEATKRKMGNHENVMLLPFAKFRQYGSGGSDEKKTTGGKTPGRSRGPKPH